MNKKKQKQKAKLKIKIIRFITLNTLTEELGTVRAYEISTRVNNRTERLQCVYYKVRYFNITCSILILIILKLFGINNQKKKLQKISFSKGPVALNLFLIIMIK